MAEHSHRDPGSGGARRWVLAGFALIAGYFLLTEHRAHVIQYLPFLLLLACPVLHIFHGHGGHGGAPKERDETPEPGKSSETPENRPGSHHHH